MVGAAFADEQGVINLTKVARLLKVTRAQLWDFVQARPKLLALIDDSRRSMVTFAENVLSGEINRHSTWAYLFLFETKLWQDFTYAEFSSDSAPRPRKPRASVGERPPKRPPLSAEERRLKALAAQAWKLRFMAKRLDVSAAELFNYQNLKPEVRAAIDDQREELADDSESILFAGLSNARRWSIILTLETLGKDRGYVRRQKDRKRKPIRQKPPKAQLPPDPAPLRADLLNGECAESARQVEAKLRTALDLNQEKVAEWFLLKLGQERGYVKDPPKKPNKVRIPPIGLAALSPEERAQYEHLRDIAQGKAPANEPAAPARAEGAEKLGHVGDVSHGQSPMWDTSPTCPVSVGSCGFVGDVSHVSRPTTIDKPEQGRPDASVSGSPSPLLAQRAQERTTDNKTNKRPVVGRDVCSDDDDWLTLVNDVLDQFKEDHRRSFDMPDPTDLFGINPDKKIYILPTGLEKPRTKQAPHSKGNKPPP